MFRTPAYWFALNQPSPSSVERQPQCRPETKIFLHVRRQPQGFRIPDKRPQVATRLYRIGTVVLSDCDKLAREEHPIY